MKEVTDKAVLEMADIFEVLSHPVRIELLRLTGLHSKKGITEAEMLQTSGLCQQELNWHLWTLKASSVILPHPDKKNRSRLNRNNIMVHNLLKYIQRSHS